MEPYQTEKFELHAAPSAADGYPVQVHRDDEFTNAPADTGFPVPYGRYLNGENFSYSTTKDPAAYLQHLRTLAPKPVPTEGGFFVENQYGEKHELRIDSFDEPETLAAFQALHQRHPTEPIVLRLEMDKLFTEAALTLTNGFQTISLDKTRVQVFSLD